MGYCGLKLTLPCTRGSAGPAPPKQQAGNSSSLSRRARSRRCQGQEQPVHQSHGWPPLAYHQPSPEHHDPRWVMGERSAVNMPQCWQSDGAAHLHSVSCRDRLPGASSAPPLPAGRVVMTNTEVPAWPVFLGTSMPTMQRGTCSGTDAILQLSCNQ